jgi:hypothetical protein
LKGSGALVQPEEGSFKLLTPVEGMDALTDYTFNTNKVHYHFCPKCGVRCFLNGTYELNDQEIAISRIFVSTLDERADSQPITALKDIKVKYYGNRDGYGRGLADEPYERGYVVDVTRGYIGGETRSHSNSFSVARKRKLDLRLCRV